MPINEKLFRHVSTMIITCQQCHTNYSLDADMIGDGKAVRCQNCSNSWHQSPVQNVPIYEPLSQMALPTPSMRPATPHEPIENTKAILSDKAIDENVNAAPETEFSSEEDALSSELLDDMFGEDIEPDAFFSDDVSNTDDNIGTNNPEDFEDPEPIPEVFFNKNNSQDEDEDEENSSNKTKKIGIAAIALVLALCGALFFGRSFIMDMIGGSQIGEGLDIQNVKSLRKDESGVDVLIVNGEVANISKEVRPVPMIKVVLYDGDEKEVEKTIVAPLKSSLKAGAKIRFRVKLSKPSALARRMEVTFSESKK